MNNRKHLNCFLFPLQHIGKVLIRVNCHIQHHRQPSADGGFGKDGLLKQAQPWRHSNCIYNSESIGELALLASIPRTS